jgi:hypothetical protein
MGRTISLEPVDPPNGEAAIGSEIRETSSGLLSTPVSASDSALPLKQKFADFFFQQNSRKFPYLFNVFTKSELIKCVL